MRAQTYKEKLAEERAAMVVAGLVSERYAGVANIEFRMTYYLRGMNRVLMERTLNFFPTNYASFNMKCMHEGCMNGGYDLAPVVASLVKSGRKSMKGRLSCHGSGDTGHASLAYEVSIRYNK